MVLKNVICFFILSKYYMRNNNAIIKCFCKLPWKAVCWKMKKETNGKVFQNVLSWYNYLLLRNQTAQALVLITRSQHMIKLSGAGIWCSFFFWESICLQFVLASYENQNIFILSIIHTDESNFMFNEKKTL